MPRATEALINLSAIISNYKQSRSAGRRAYAVIKANAYGHGAKAVAQALQEHADGFAVAFTDEALALRHAGIQKPILVLEGGHCTEDWSQAAENHLTMVIHHEDQIQDLMRCQRSGDVSIWLKINTGMNRIGIAPERLPDVSERLRNSNLSPEIMMTHFACADNTENPMTSGQMALFRKHCPEQSEISVCNSAGILGHPDITDDICRPGIMLYGGSPFGYNNKDTLTDHLLPAMTLTAGIISVHRVCAGETVGYAGQWTAREDTVIAIAAIGYGDGYPRHAPNGTPVWIRGKRYGLAGKVSMDMVAIDLGENPDNINVGESAELWGENISADEIAHLCGTICYELFCSVTARVPRRYTS